MLKNGPWKFSEESEKNTTFLKSRSLEVVMLLILRQVLREYRIRLVREEKIFMKCKKIFDQEILAGSKNP